MKKTLLIIAILFSLKCFSQESQKERVFKAKPIKVAIVSSGSLIIAGAAVDLIRNFQKEPSILNDVSPILYAKKQKDLRTVSSICYALSGVSLITICFNF